MNVAYLSFLYPNLKITGGALHALNIVRELHKKIDVTVFVPNINIDTLPNDLNIIPVNFFNKPLFSMLSFAFRTSKIIRKENFDIIHSNELSGLFVKTIDVVTFHHLPVTVKQRIHKFPTYVTSNKANIITTVSEKTKNSLKKKGYDNVIVIPNGVDPTFLNPIAKIKKDHLKEMYGIDSDSENIILYVNSNFSKRKNFPLVLSTTEYLLERESNFKLLMIGPANKKDFVKRKFARIGMDDRLIYISDISQNLMPYHYAISDFLIMPSFQEGFGLPLIEALACGKPFVSFDVGIASELVENGFGFIAKTNRDFKKICLDLIKNPIVYTSSKRYIKNHYSWASASKKLISIYEGLL
ncbi:MAG: glycosyltransferase family 4 protein [Candidatus Thermoplasmatota archaeon]|nr:glycosyltransferase family 4 protein [Candidatus Thermoplasmatota archaeon]